METLDHQSSAGPLCLFRSVVCVSAKKILLKNFSETNLGGKFLRVRGWKEILHSSSLATTSYFTLITCLITSLGNVSEVRNGNEAACDWATIRFFFFLFFSSGSRAEVWESAVCELLMRPAVEVRKGTGWLRQWCLIGCGVWLILAVFRVQVLKWLAGC